MRIAVCGSAASMEAPVHDIACSLGEVLAKRGHTILVDPCPGIPYDVASAAFAACGTVIAYSQARNIDEHRAENRREGVYTETLFFPSDIPHIDSKEARFKMRNMLMIDACDAIVIISGRIGTLNEFTLAYDLVKPIGVLTGTGGTADLVQSIVKAIPKEPKPFSAFSADPEELLKALEETML